jgi:hypothetical protein
MRPLLSIWSSPMTKATRRLQTARATPASGLVGRPILETTPTSAVRTGHGQCRSGCPTTDKRPVPTSDRIDPQPTIVGRCLPRRGTYTPHIRLPVARPARLRSNMPHLTHLPILACAALASNPTGMAAQDRAPTRDAADIRADLSLSTEPTHAKRIGGKDDEIDTDDHTLIQVSYALRIGNGNRTVEACIVWIAWEADKNVKPNDTVFQSVRDWHDVYRQPSDDPRPIEFLRGSLSGSFKADMAGGNLHGWRDFPNVGQMQSIQVEFDMDGRDDLRCQRMRGTIGLSMRLGAAQMPGTPSKLPPPSHEQVAQRWAPIVYQDIDRTGKHSLGGRSDYLARIDYDGDWNPLNNWRNLEIHPPTGAVYYSVAECHHYWYLVYGFFHPRDWAEHPVPGQIDEHENDFEGVIMFIMKPPPDSNESFGQLLGSVTVAHHDFYSYVPRSSALKNGPPHGKVVIRHEDVDGLLSMILHDGIRRPTFMIECRGHGVHAFQEDTFRRRAGSDYVRYVPGALAAAPIGDPIEDVAYELICITGPHGPWTRRADEAIFNKDGRMLGGQEHGARDAANMPWGWDDRDDGAVQAGAMARAPVDLAIHYFSQWPYVPGPLVVQPYR